jgi:hypothetical protein
MKKHKLNGVDAWIIQSKCVVEYNNYKITYSKSLESMSNDFLTFLGHTYHDSQDGICE